MRAEEIQGLMEAYSKVHETPEVLSEGPYDAATVRRAQQAQQGRDSLKNVGGYAGLSRAAAAAGDTAGAKRYMQKSQQIGDKKKADEARATAASKATADSRRAADREAYRRAMNPGSNPTSAGRPTSDPSVSSTPSNTKNSPYTAKNLGDAQYKAYKAGGGDAAMAQGKGTAAQIIARGRKASAGAKTSPTSSPSAPTSSPSARPSARTPAPAAPKTTTPAAPAKPAGSAMDQWAKANPKLAAAKAERDRTRGTSATTNPLMKDMKDKLPAPTQSAASAAAYSGGKPFSGTPKVELPGKEINTSVTKPTPTPAAKPVETLKPKPTPTQVRQGITSGVDIFDLVKGHLLDEGYADSEEGAMVIMVNMSEEWRKSILEAHGVQQLDEISQKTATSAYASSKTGEFEGADSDRDVKRTDNLKKHIVRKFGKEAGEHADKAAEAQTFGRKDASGRRKQTAKPRIEKSDYRTTEDGKMHKQDQRELKTELRIKRDRRLRKEDLEAWVDELIAEGYDLSEYTWEEVAEIYAQELELSEAQRARENPEDHDKEEKRKYEPVRGERTPMPPRGDKRREEFEKWYAKQMGR